MDSPVDRQSGRSAGRIIWRWGLTLFAVIFIQLLCYGVPRVVYWVEAVVPVTAIRYAVSWVLAVGFILTAVVVWSLARVLIPKIMKYATPILFMLFVLFALLPGWLLQTREQARRQRLLKNMMQLGRKVQDSEQRAGHSLSPEELESLLADPELAPPDASVTESRIHAF